jgi:flagellar protein FliS
MTSPALRERYLSGTVTTASPAQLLVMLYDRLVLDVTRAEDALRAGNREVAAQQLMHAQDIVIELRSTLDTSSWSGAAGLAQLYAFLLTELIAANVKADADKVAACRALVEPLRDAWKQAALATAGTAEPAAPQTG